MTEIRSDIAITPILHHYDYSPFSEKIRLIFGIKHAAWWSVDAPAVMPKPDLIALTGGYRHIPVMQIGADVYCDTRTIARELERRYPTPSLAGQLNPGVTRAIEAWVERDLFWPVARFVSGVNAGQVGPQLHVDRAALRGKPAPSPQVLAAVARRSLTQVRAQLPIIESMLDGTSPPLSAQTPSVADLAVYHTLWFLSAFPIDCADELVPYGKTRAWMADMAGIGHGHPAPLSAQAALQIAGSHSPVTLRPSLADESLPPTGSLVTVRPDDYVTAEVVGRLVQQDADDVSVLRNDPALGQVMMHFPRVGYTIKARRAAKQP